MAGRVIGETKQALTLVRAGIKPYEAAKLAGVSVPTVYRAMRAAGIEVREYKRQLPQLAAQEA